MLLPAGLRQRDQTQKSPTGPLDREALLQHLEKQALEAGEREDLVPFTGEKKGEGTWGGHGGDMGGRGPAALGIFSSAEWSSPAARVSRASWVPASAGHGHPLAMSPPMWPPHAMSPTPRNNATNSTDNPGNAKPGMATLWQCRPGNVTPSTATQWQCHPGNSHPMAMPP